VLSLPGGGGEEKKRPGVTTNEGSEKTKKPKGDRVSPKPRAPRIRKKRTPYKERRNAQWAPQIGARRRKDIKKKVKLQGGSFER